MEFKLWEHVRIKRNGVIGQIIDISEGKNGKVYIVESDTKGERDDADYPGDWPLYDCTKDDMEKEEVTMNVTTIKAITAMILDTANNDDLKGWDDYRRGRRDAYHIILGIIKEELIANELDWQKFGL